MSVRHLWSELESEQVVGKPADATSPSRYPAQSGADSASPYKFVQYAAGTAMDSGRSPSRNAAEPTPASVVAHGGHALGMRPGSHQQPAPARAFGVAGPAPMTPAERFAARMAVLAELAPSIAHDFNNLMMTISAHVLVAHAATSAPSGASGADRLGSHFTAIDDAAARAREVTRSLLSLTRPERAGTDHVDLSLVAHETAAVLRRLLPPSLNIRVHAQPNSEVIDGNADQLRQALLHLALRAKRALCEGGEILFVVNSTPADRAGDGWSRIRVLYTGSPSGAAHAAGRADLEAVMSSDEQVRVAASIVQEHGGSLSVWQSKGGGERFDMVLPHRQPSSAANRWLLLVTADDQVRRSVAEALLASSWSLVTVPSLESTQPRLLGAAGQPAAVIIDSSAAAGAAALPAEVSDTLSALPTLVVGQGHGQRTVRSLLPQIVEPKPALAPASVTPRSRPGIFADEPLAPDVVQRWVAAISA